MGLQVIELTGGVYPSEFQNVDKVAEKHLGAPGRLLGFSKSGYRDKHPGDTVVFNANVFAGRTKVWYGDLNLSFQDGLRLQALAVELGQPVAVLYEHDGRFEREDNPNLENSVEVYWPAEGELETKG